MRCRQAEKLIFDYIDGVISESDRLGLERHLGECRTCEATSSAAREEPRSSPSSSEGGAQRELQLETEAPAFA